MLLVISSFGLLKSQALSDSSKAEDLLAKCSGIHVYVWSNVHCSCHVVPILLALKALCEQKEEELACKEQTISELQHQLRAVKARHCQELMEVQVRAQQDAYVARHLGGQDKPQRRAKKTKS